MKREKGDTGKVKFVFKREKGDTGKVRFVWKREKKEGEMCM